MFRPSAAFAILLAIVASNPAPASVVDENSSLVIFGDSLSDVGRASAAIEATYGVEYPPSPPYYGVHLPNGTYAARFSNGPIWADVLGARFTALDKPVENYAFGGATATGTGAADLGGQIVQFGLTRILGPDLGDDPLAAMWIGANELFAGIEAGLDRAGFSALSKDIGKAVRVAAGALDAAGIDDMLLFNLPPLSDVPATLGLDAARIASEEFNAEIENVAGDLRSDGWNVLEVDVAALFARAGSLGFENLTEPCAVALFDPEAPSVSVLKDCTKEPGVDVSEYLFFDPRHPTSRAHSLIAAEITGEPATVPAPAALPALVGAVLLLAGIARRRA